ncbi:MAG: hypothetical protein U0325_28615 [Polyangiales bacterium]
MSAALDHPQTPRALLALSVGLVALQAAVAPLWDADLWWLLRAGEDLLRDGAVPRHNRYGFTAPTHPWVMHEWLLGAAGAGLVRAFGLPGIALLRIAATLTVGAFAWRVALRGARPLAAAIAVAAMFALFGGRFESARPLGLAYAPAMVVVWAAFAPALRARHALAAIVATALWTNAHGSFPLALVTLAAGAWESPDRRRVALVAACAAVTFVNPYGPRMHDLVARYLGGVDGDAVAVVHQRIVEWWPLHRAPLRMYRPPELLGYIAVVALWLRALRHPRWRPRAVFGLALCAMALRHQRHLQLAGLLSLPLLAPVLGPGAGGERSRARGALLTVGLIALVVWAAVARARPVARWVNPTRDPADFARLHAALPADARLFATLPFAGYAVFRRGPAVFFDPRNDCYPADVLREALDLDEGRSPPAETDRRLRARGTTHAIAWCEGRAARALGAWTPTLRAGALCLWTAPTR